MFFLSLEGHHEGKVDQDRRVRLPVRQPQRQEEGSCLGGDAVNCVVSLRTGGER